MQVVLVTSNFAHTNDGWVITPSLRIPTSSVIEVSMELSRRGYPLVYSIGEVEVFNADMDDTQLELLCT